MMGCLWGIAGVDILQISTESMEVTPIREADASPIIPSKPIHEGTNSKGPKTLFFFCRVLFPLEITAFGLVVQMFTDTCLVRVVSV